ncbi:hypothetical protein LCGC14_2474390 [marine sediment metagenome]|uniref:Uncharacterized protein n=1 Tax=marine sediment metagenome TaxID=412755 RepID=A0A0F9DLI9_9ZZZZ
MGEMDYLFDTDAWFILPAQERLDTYLYVCTNCSIIMDKENCSRCDAETTRAKLQGVSPEGDKWKMIFGTGTVDER